MKSLAFADNHSVSYIEPHKITALKHLMEKKMVTGIGEITKGGSSHALSGHPLQCRRNLQSLMKSDHVSL
jgi:hypothetical protein